MFVGTSRPPSQPPTITKNHKKTNYPFFRVSWGLGPPSSTRDIIKSFEIRLVCVFSVRFVWSLPLALPPTKDNQKINKQIIVFLPFSGVPPPFHVPSTKETIEPSEVQNIRFFLVVLCAPTQHIMHSRCLIRWYSILYQRIQRLCYDLRGVVGGPVRAKTKQNCFYTCRSESSKAVLPGFAKEVPCLR